MRRLVQLLSTLLALLAPVGAVSAGPAATVTDVRTGVDAERTRVVLDLDRPVAFTLFGLADPYRLVVDLPEVDWRAERPARPRTVGVVSGLRVGLFRPGTSRLVLDLTTPVRVLDARLLPPEANGVHRLLLDLAATDQRSFLAALAQPAVFSAVPAAPPPPLRQRIVVVDAGHGGIDPGAISPSGYFEKDLTLVYARDLKRRLEQTAGYRVVLTRDTDEFLSLKERVKRARAAGGDLFISLHADAIDNKRVRGGAVYTLSENASDKEAAALAARENKADVIAGVSLDVQDEEVASILIDLAQRETMNRSAVFAIAAVDSMSSGKVRLRSRPHRFAGFRVLKAPDVPSVLVELGYLSNPNEEQVLRSTRGRATVNQALVAAVERYFAALKD